MDAISSSDSIDKELTKKSLSTLLLFTDMKYQFIKNDTKIPTKLILKIISNSIKGIKIIPSLGDSS
jgi:hypothetical protein